MSTVTCREMVAAIAWAILVMALTAIPYELARRHMPLNAHFSGFIWGVDDGNVYLSWIRQAAEGRVLLRNQYTTKDQRPHFLNLFLLALGRLCAVTGAAPLAAWAAARYICGAFCLVTIYLLAAELSPQRAVRVASLGLAALSSGLGWIVVMAGQGGRLWGGLDAFPMDVADGWQAQPEAIVFSSLLLNPLFSFSLGLIALIMRDAARLMGPWGPRAALTLGVLLLILGNIHGYDVFPLHLTLALWLACAWFTGRLRLKHALARYAVILAISAPSLAWAWYTAKADPSYAAKVSTPTLTPRPWDVAMGYGLVLVYATVGAWLVCRTGGEAARRTATRLLFAALALGLAGFSAQQARMPVTMLGWFVLPLPLLAVLAMISQRDANDRQWLSAFPILWAACGAAAVYLPVPFQRKMIEGLHIPLCLLAAQMLAAVLTRSLSGKATDPLGRPVRVALAVALLVATVPSNVVFAAECLRHVWANNRTLLHVLAPPVYLTGEEVAAMGWLSRHSQEHDVVLSSSLTGSHIPVYAPCRVVVGHWAETLQFRDFLGQAHAFYDPHRSSEERQALLRLTGATFVWYGPQEALLAQAAGYRAVFDPCADLLGTRLVYRNPTVRIYRVEEVGPSGS